MMVVVNYLSFDVEEWFHSSNFDDIIARDQWTELGGRVQRNVSRILEVLAGRQVKATFFILGWVAEQFPQMVREIASGGHEIGAHGYGHRLIHSQTPAEFEADVKKCLECLSQAGAPDVAGYRAPSYSVTRDSLWALDVLVELGFRYDSSVYPVRFHNRYGIPDAPRSPHLIRPSLAEFPLPVVDLGGLSVPVATGAYFRLFPYAVTRAAMRRLNRAGLPVTVDLHPWELDTGQPYVKLPLSRGFRHYTNLGRMEARLRRLIDEFEFREIAAGLAGLMPVPGVSSAVRTS
jgi:polysaccharide deacetylase family protein (PEP-CTERM system associated)